MLNRPGSNGAPGYKAGQFVRAIPTETRSLSSQHVEEVGFRERSRGNSFPAHGKIMRPQDDVLNLRIRPYPSIIVISAEPILLECYKLLGNRDEGFGGLLIVW